MAISRATLAAMVADDEFGLLDSPADSDEAVDGWTWGEIRAIATQCAAYDLRYTVDLIDKAGESFSSIDGMPFDEAVDHVAESLTGTWTDGFTRPEIEPTAAQYETARHIVDRCMDSVWTRHGYAISVRTVSA